VITSEWANSLSTLGEHAPVLLGFVVCTYVVLIAITARWWAPCIPTRSAGPTPRKCSVDSWVSAGAVPGDEPGRQFSHQPGHDHDSGARRTTPSSFWR
jgi:hypothetical protein